MTDAYYLGGPKSRFVRILPLLVPVALGLQASAQSFTGVPGAANGLLRITQNPALVNTATTGAEFQVLSFGLLAGTNAASFPIGSGDIRREPGHKDRHVWFNADILGPAASFSVQNKHQFGIYTRSRVIVRGGGVPAPVASLVDPAVSRLADTFISVKDAGVAAHAFGEIGFTYGRVLLDDYYRRFTVGATVKYVMGFMAASASVPTGSLAQDTAGQITRAQGDIAVAFTSQGGALFAGDNGNLFSPGGKTVALDLGMTYEYHPNGSPNEETPYLYRVSASLTDLGAITYKADTGSGQYAVTVRRSDTESPKKEDGDRLPGYVDKLIADSLVMRRSALQDFRMALPTALRLNGDVSLGGPVWLSADILLNLRRAAGTLYTASYVSQLYLTPRLELGRFSIGIPFGYVGYQTVTAGVVLRAGPLVIGSASALSAALAQRVRTADAYLGLAFKLRKKKTGR